MNMARIQELPIRPAPGEIMLYIDLNILENMTPWEALKLSESLGFTPQLRSRVWLENGEEKAGVYALLHHEQRSYDSVLEASYVTDTQFEELSEAIMPSDAVRFAYNLKRSRSLEPAAA